MIFTKKGLKRGPNQGIMIDTGINTGTGIKYNWQYSLSNH